MRVIVGCEFSGEVREAFAALGHDAWSCDLLPSERPGQHIQGDILEVLDNPRVYGKFDLGIFHPECTFLANSGVRWLYGARGRRRDKKRWGAMEDAAAFFKKLLFHPALKMVAVENPIMHGHAKKLIGQEPSCIVQPWMFGHPETKATCFWLRDLPKLQPTKIVSGRKPRVHFESPGPDRWKRRSRTLPGLAKAMAEQWGKEQPCS